VTRADRTRAAAGVGLILMLSANGCVRREGRNADCQWPQEAVAPLDLSGTGHVRHLAGDAQFAEELGIRHGDAFRGRESVEERGRRVEECTARLMTYLSMLHSVPLGDVERARARRETRVDVVAVFAPMAVVFGTLAYAVAGRIRRRFPSGVPRVVATLLVALAVAGAGVMIGELWSWLVEIVRVGDSHLSYRAFRLPWTRYRGAIFAAGTMIFLVMAWTRSRKDLTVSAGKRQE
jgi:hypothetical protein